MQVAKTSNNANAIVGIDFEDSKATQADIAFDPEHVTTRFDEIPILSIPETCVWDMWIDFRSRRFIASSISLPVALQGFGESRYLGPGIAVSSKERVISSIYVWESAE